MPVREFVSCHPISKRAEAYGLEGVTVDGMDLEEVAAAAERAAAQVRSGTGPAFVETVTYRFRGHYVGDPEFTYRTKEEVQAWREKCPVRSFKARLLEEGIGEADLAAMEKQIVEELENDKAWALDQPSPTVDQATDHVIIPLTAQNEEQA